jgi:hypothetical protein
MKKGDADRGESIIPGRRRRRGEPEEPLEIQLTVAFRFGDEPNDRVVVIDDRRIPMVDNVFDRRDAIVRNFVRLLLKASVSQPKVLQELVPALKLLSRRGRATRS